jgi:hypothetical protein
MVNSFDPIQPHGAFHGLRARHVLRGFLWDNGLSIVFAFFLANYLLPNGLPASSDFEIDAVFGSPEYNLLFLPIGLCCTGFGGYLAAMRCVGAEIKNAVAVGIASLLLGVATSLISSSAGNPPLWTAIVCLVLLLPAAAAGGAYASSRHKATT